MGWLPIIFYIIIGAGVLVVLDFPRKAVNWTGFLALAYWLGILATTFVITLIAVVSGKFLFEIFWLLVFISALLLTKRRRTLCEFFRTLEPIKPKKQLLRLLVILPFLAFALVNLYYAYSISMDFPIVSFDAIGNFALKGKLWFYSRDLRPPQLLNPEYLIYKRCYPPAIPVTECVWSTFWGEWVGQKMKYIFLFCWVSVGILIYSFLRRKNNTFTAWLATSIWFVVPVNTSYIWGGAIVGFGDIPLAMGFLAATLAVSILYSSNKISHILLMSILIAGTFWIKKEGIPFALLLVGYLVVKRVRLRTVAIVLGVIIGFYFINLLSSLNLPKFFEKDVSLKLPLSELIFRLKNYPLFLAEELSMDSIWGEKLWYLFAIAWLFKILYIKRKDMFNKEFFLFVFMFLLYSAVMIFTVFDFHRNTNWVFERLFIQIYPLLLLATFDGVNFKPTAEINPSAEN